MYKLFYTKGAKEDLRNLEKSVARRIKNKLLFYSSQKDIYVFAKPLHNLGLNKYRFRVGDYRIIFSPCPKGIVIVLFILKIKHRKDIYSD